MKSSVLLFGLMGFLVICCNTNKKESIKRSLLLETPLPKNVLDEYLKKISLKDIESGVDSFEIRKWYPFYYTDSFPIALERFFYQNHVLNAECYLFSDKMGGLITSNEELNGFKVDKYVVNNLPLSFIDSIKSKFSLALIESFDINIITQKNKTGFSTGTARNVFFEQATQLHYYGAFFSDPEFYPGLHPSIDKYAAFARFTHETLVQGDTAFAKWFNEKGQRIANNR